MTAIHKSVAEVHRCINRPACVLISLRSSPGPHSISGPSWGRDPECSLLGLALINTFCSDGKEQQEVLTLLAETHVAALLGGWGEGFGGGVGGELKDLCHGLVHNAPGSRSESK